MSDAWSGDDVFLRRLRDLLRRRGKPTPEEQRRSQVLQPVLRARRSRKRRGPS